MTRLGPSINVFSWVIVLTFMMCVNGYSQNAFTFKTFDPSVWPRTDADLGVAGFVIEDFEDGALAQGLRVELSDSTDAFGPTDSLPVAFDPTVNDPNSEQVFTPGVWDGARVLLNRRTRPPSGYADLIWSDVTFHVPGGASSFGFSLQNMDLDAELFVNGVSQGSLSSRLSTGGGRNGYLRIDAGPGVAITSVKVANSDGDGLAFDHVAFKPPRRPGAVSTASAQGSDLYNNTNINGVGNGPTTSPQFVLNSPATITQLVTYHWNFGRGATPGTIGLRNQNGRIFGPFPARGTSGQGGAPNVNWVASVNVAVPAGLYTVLDSDPNTWSNNARSGFRGFAIVRGSLLGTPPLPRPPACQPVTVYIRNLRYDDYSRYTSLSTTSVAPGGFFQIVTNCLQFDGQVVVTLQDVNRGSGSGVTAFRLTNVRVNGNVVTAQAPNLPLFRNRTYHVAVFVYGQQPWKTANPGQLTIR